MAVDYRAEAVKAAHKYGIPVQPFLAQLNQESGFRAGGITSSAGAKWIGQFIPSTAKAYGVHDDLSSIYGAAHYMADNIRQYHTLARALSAYNSGRPDAYLNPSFAGGQTYNYVRAILGNHPAAAGGAPAPSPPAVTAPTTAPAAAGIPAAVQQILNANNRAVGLAPVNYGTPALPAQIHPDVKVEVDHRAPLSPNAPRVIQLAEKYLGTAYKWGGASPKTGFDCSGLLQWANAQVGVKIPRTTYEQWKAGTPVAKGRLKPGDAVFFEPTSQGPGHVGIFIGHGQFLQSPHTGDVVKISRLADYAKVYVGARRFA